MFNLTRNTFLSKKGISKEVKMVAIKRIVDPEFCMLVRYQPYKRIEKYHTRKR